MEHQAHKSGTDSPDNSAHPLSDDAAKAQVVDAAKQIVAAARLQGVEAGFDFSSCNDQGDPPYMGEVRVVFDLPPGGQPDADFHKIGTAITGAGWTKDTRPWATNTFNKGGVTAEMQPLPSNPRKGLIIIYGECRNMTDHHHDGKTNSTDVTAQVK